jgi:hypothetical protein
VPWRLRVRGESYALGMTNGSLVLVSALSAAALTGAVSYVVVKVQMWNESKERKLDRASQQEEARRADERNLRDARRERIRRDYEDVSFAATEMQGATVQISWLDAGDTEEARNARVNDRLKEATKDLGRAILRLQLEGVEELVESYQEVRTLWYDFTSDLAQKKYGDVSKTLTKMQATVTSILDKTRADLGDLSKPI